MIENEELDQVDKLNKLKFNKSSADDSNLLSSSCSSSNSLGAMSTHILPEMLKNEAEHSKRRNSDNINSPTMSSGLNKTIQKI